MAVRRLGIALAMGAALTAASCTIDLDDAGSTASDAGAAASSAVDEAGDAAGDAAPDAPDGANDEPTDAPVADLLLTPEETSLPMEPVDSGMLAHAGAGFEVPEGMELEVDPPECAEAADMNATLAGDVSEGGMAALVGGGDDAGAMFTVQVLRTSVSFDDYKSNWENCADVQFTGEALGISGSSAEVDPPEIEGTDEVLGRTSDTRVEALGGGGQMTNLVYLTEVRGVKVVAGAITAPNGGGELGPEVGSELADLLTRQVAKINDAG